MGEFKNRAFAQRLGFALRGLGHALRSERSLKVQVAAFGAALVALLILHPGAPWWALTLTVSALVITAELINTAIEQLVDRLHPGIDPQIRIVKDCAAAAVLVASLGALAVALALAVHLLRR